MPVLTPLLVIALLHGLTEFLPVSQLAHDIPAHALLARIGLSNAPQEAAALAPVFVSLGCALAAALYCWREIGLLFIGFGQIVTRKGGTGARLIGQLLMACLPMPGVAYLVLVENVAIMPDIQLLAWVTLGGGFLLLLIDRAALTIRRTEHLSMPGFFFIGLLHFAALVPGAGRAALVIVGARFLGCERDDAVRLGALLGIPWLLGVAAADLYLRQSSGAPLPAPGAEAGLLFGCGFIAALIGLGSLLSWVKEGSLAPLAVYRMLLGAGLLVGGFAGVL